MLRFVLITTLSWLGFCHSAHAEKLFTYNGQAVELKSLSPAHQQQLYDFEKEFLSKKSLLLNEAIFEKYVAEEAKKRKQTPEQVKSNLLKSSPATEKEITTWFQQNQARLGGRKLADIKEDVKFFLEKQSKEEAKSKLIEQIKQQKKIQIFEKSISAPLVDIKVAGFPHKGSTAPKATIVEFADYQCGHCQHAFEEISKIYKKYKNNIQVIYMDFPLNPNGVSNIVAQGGVCADKQNKFWEYHDLAFKAKGKLTNDSPIQFATNLKLNPAQFKSCLHSAETKAKIASARAEGERIGVRGTPAIYINKKRVNSYTFDFLESEIKTLL